MNRLTRSKNDRLVAGVCAGIGRRYGYSATKVRWLFVLSCLLPGPQFVLYIILWVLIPLETDVPPAAETAG
jgi:phage shock protein PspC (stress-responsive transcriptional regulator)